MDQRIGVSHFLSLCTGDPVPTGGDPLGPRGGERVLWRGHAAVAEHLVAEPAGRSVVRWTLPPATRVVVTDRRLAYSHAVEPADPAPARAWPPHRAPDRPGGRHRRPEDEVAGGEVRWQWPTDLHVCPGNPAGSGTAGPRAARPNEIHLVCGTNDSRVRPAVVLSGGTLGTVGDADRLANLIRRAIVQFRLDHQHTLGLPPARYRALAARLMAPQFANHHGGPRQSVRLPGALPLVTWSTRQARWPEPAVGRARAS